MKPTKAGSSNQTKPMAVQQQQLFLHDGANKQSNPNTGLCELAQICSAISSNLLQRRLIVRRAPAAPPLTDSFFYWGRVTVINKGIQYITVEEEIQNIKRN